MNNAHIEIITKRVRTYTAYVRGHTRKQSTPSEFSVFFQSVYRAPQRPAAVSARGIRNFPSAYGEKRAMISARRERRVAPGRGPREKKSSTPRTLGDISIHVRFPSRGISIS